MLIYVKYMHQYYRTSASEYSKKLCKKILVRLGIDSESNLPRKSQ